ncbi:8-amino-7-oxononanoate synthase [Flavobacterium arcticum]|uniref:8-amino-7-oxononanoate synthase n=1 Tax=Flavobacterium arcticum TaxID=1784713 RepID=A0A345HB43_9FLAO|nr:8-amino-7-oxononanoate synthase [Flavobacterium arcticum]AXG73803.1 8-amino-7-oxononanoate synthase [Flavobacterium arcticum]KAF2511754.1 8-amino-7-oxononanoate synthase [Flavobacterium arcticum]
MQQLPKSLSDKLAQRQQNGLLRQLPTPSSLIDFASNDYLGLSQSKTIFDAAHQYLIEHNSITNGATGSRLISGNHNIYNQVESYIAQVHNTKNALIFNSGYDANVGFFSCVPQKGDVVLYDEFIHASIRDGMRLSNAIAYKFPHNNLDALKKLIERHKGTAIELYIVTESVFSMDGDSPDLTALAELAANHNCKLIVDEAHALGVFGIKGEGLVQHLELQDKVFARIMTFGKGLGSHGAVILGSKALMDYLVNFARSFIYTTGLPPHSVATVFCAYKQLQEDDENRKKLKSNIQFFKAEVKRLELTTFIHSNSAIHCTILSGNEKVKNIAQQLQHSGYNVKAILSPTVPKEKERLRFCLHSYNTPSEITAVLAHLKLTLQA